MCAGEQSLPVNIFPLVALVGSGRAADEPGESRLQLDAGIAPPQFRFHVAGGLLGG